MKFTPELLRMYRARKQMSQREVCEKTEMSRNTYWVIETNQKTTPIQNLVKIFEVLELSDEEILKVMKGE